MANADTIVNKVLMKVYKIMPENVTPNGTFYPVSVEGLYGKHGLRIFNCKQPIPEGTTYVMGTLYTYKGEFAVKEVVPYNPK